MCTSSPPTRAPSPRCRRSTSSRRRCWPSWPAADRTLGCPASSSAAPPSRTSLSPSRLAEAHTPHHHKETTTVMPGITTSARTEKPLIPTNTISPGTLASIDLQESRRFYEEVLGFAVIQLSPLSMLLRLGTDHVYVVV